MEFLALFAFLFNIALPLAVILFLVWVYQIKKNSELTTRQNQRIMKLLEELNRKS
ncbi:hypothetical protein [Oceanobacillus kapialis]|uniref:DUF4083 domain-containing protein n=1 Tax=Oceanobacillus kapialis TaxID=481353 RepID=A0ABW5PW39_9BACI